jgi:molybdate transport system regulatory protein
MEAQGKVWVKSDKGVFGPGRIKLLELIDETGSISKAAKEIGMSYKAAWAAIEKMNNLSENLLVIKATGGKSGGGSRLSEDARAIIKAFYDAQEKHPQEPVQGNSTEAGSITFLEASTKNLYKGVVSNILTGPINATVGIQLRGLDILASVITRESLKRMDLKKDDTVHALVNDRSITLIKGDARNLAISARNRLAGSIIRIDTSGVSAEVTLELKGGQTLHTIITMESLDTMSLKEGDQVTAIFKAQAVILLK